MENYLGFSFDELSEKKAYWTAREISQQPNCWKKAVEIVKEKRAEIDDFIQQITSHKLHNIIFTGAGTSAFVGEALAAILTKENNKNCSENSNLNKLNFKDVATTDLVADPYAYLNDIPTLLVSFARSGNSPESKASIDICNQILTNVKHLIITCNIDGEMAQNADLDNSLVLYMPAETNDKSFAMTSSFSSMFLSAYLCFSPKNEADVVKSIAKSEGDFADFIDEIKQLASLDLQRVVYLGTGIMQGLAHEAALKLLELTAGKMVALHESPLGFRHGPKSIINTQTLVLILGNTDNYTKQYERDLYNEIKGDNTAAIRCLNFKQLPISQFLSCCLFVQSFAFFCSLKLLISPDNPCPTGEVNRVVQGVNIYNLQQE